MIIGLGGSKGAGKNTVAKIIAEEFGNRFAVSEWSFAEDLKISAAEALGVESNHIDFCDMLKATGKIRVYTGFKIENEDTGEIGNYLELSGREYLQWYGTEAHRDVFGPDFWVDNLFKKIDADYEDGDLARLDLITDTRFENEAEAIGLEGGYVVRVYRPEVEDSGDAHASETPLPNHLVDATILNDQGFDELRGEVIRCISLITK